MGVDVWGDAVRPLVTRRSCGHGLASVALLAALLVGGCSIGDRERHADAIRATRARAAGVGALAGTATYDLRLHDRSREQVEDLLGFAPAKMRLQADIVVDASKGRAEVRFGPGDLPAERATASGPEAALAALEEAASGAAAEPPQPAGPEAGAAPLEPRPIAAIFEDSTVFVKRQNLRPTERRTWARLDFARLPESEPRPPSDDLAGNASLVAVATTANPSYLLDLATGALAGSAKRIGTAEIEGVPFTRYSANVSFDKASTERELEDDALETRSLMYRLLGFREDIVPAQFWIAADGSLRRMRIEVPQRVNRRRSDRLVVTLDLVGPAPAGVSAGPAADETVTYLRYGRLLRAASPAA